MASEFAPGANLIVLAAPETTAASSSHAPAHISLEVVKPFVPFTTAVVAHVSLGHSAQSNLGLTSSTAVLKLYDRRGFIEQREQFCDVGARVFPYTPESESAYRAFLQDAQLGRVDYTSNIDDDDWFLSRAAAPHGEFELALQRMAIRNCAKEIRAYRHLNNYQGTIIPRLYATVQYPVKVQLADGAYVDDVIPGLLIEYISDYTLEQFATSFFSTSYADRPGILADVCRRAMEVSTFFRANNVLHDDLRLANMLVREPLYESHDGRTTLSRCAVVMIDLDFILMREDYSSDDAFEEAESCVDMLTAIGYPLGKLVPPEVWRFDWKEWMVPSQRIL